MKFDFSCFLGGSKLEPLRRKKVESAYVSYPSFRPLKPSIFPKRPDIHVHQATWDIYIYFPPVPYPACFIYHIMPQFPTTIDTHILQLHHHLSPLSLSSKFVMNTTKKESPKKGVRKKKYIRPSVEMKNKYVCLPLKVRFFFSISNFQFSPKIKCK